MRRPFYIRKKTDFGHTYFPLFMLEKEPFLQVLQGKNKSIRSDFGPLLVYDKRENTLHEKCNLLGSDQTARVKKDSVLFLSATTTMNVKSEIHLCISSRSRDSRDTVYVVSISNNNHSSQTDRQSALFLSGTTTIRVKSEIRLCKPIMQSEQRLERQSRCCFYQQKQPST